MRDRESGSRRTRVAVLFGGRSGEHDVSLRSAETIMSALDPGKYEVVPVGITREGTWLTGGDPLAQLEASSPFFALSSGSVATDSSSSANLPASGIGPERLPASIVDAVDVVFPVLHGPMGEDGTVQGMLELAGLPYVGSGVLGSAVAMDKAITKVILTEAGLPQLPWRLVHRREWVRDAEAITAAIAGSIGFPCFIKPANLGSSVGISKVNAVEQLEDAMNLAARYDRRLIVEQGTDAREIEMAVLGNDEPMASVAGEIVPRGDLYDFNAKYVDDSAELIIPAKLTPDVLAHMQELALVAFQSLDLAGMARVDFFLERSTDQIYINEVNTIPGFTSISMYPMLWQASGLPVSALVDRLIELAVERYGETH
jgi:D-alanine-D-alanine ligase